MSYARFGVACKTLFISSLLAATVAFAGPARNFPQQDNSQAAPEPQAADGRRHGMPAEAFAVAPGTKFLVTLEQDLTSRDTQENTRFVVRTVEPLEAAHGIYLPPGAEIHGHVSRIESARQTGRAKIWLTFDDIYTKLGSCPSWRKWSTCRGITA